MKLTAKHIQLNAAPRDKREAIEAAAQILIATGNIEPGYVEGIFEREEQANTYLGRGIAIPHGTPAKRDFIRETGIAVLQVPGGVSWNKGEQARLVVAIAAKSDEHLQILAALMDVLDDADTAERLATTDDVSDIIRALNREGETGASAPTIAAGAGPFIEARIIGEAGMHARPATEFVAIASSFTSEIAVEYEGKSANGKAMASLLRLGAPGGATLRISAVGPDADEALEALAEAMADGLGDLPGDENALPPAPAPTWTPVSQGRALEGAPASPGVAIGKLFRLRAQTVTVRDERGDFERDSPRLRTAISDAKAQLDALVESVTARGGADEAAIFRAHQALLGDPDLLRETELLMKNGHGAAWSWKTATQAQATEMRANDNALLAERAADVLDVGQRVLRLLTGQGGESAMPTEPVILLADDLAPSDTARLDPTNVLGFCTALGGPTSHTAIIARSLEIPAIVGVGELDGATEGAVCVLDGGAGRLYLQPTGEDLASATAFQRELETQRDREYATRFSPALMRGGHRVEVTANIGKAADAQVAVETGAEGVGLLRTEFLFLERQTPPSEDEQFEALREMTRALNGLPLIVRTLDIGGDKVVPYLDLPHEENPFLGVRGARLTLRRPDLFEPQLRAIYRASKLGPVKIMFPMIATPGELREARAIAERVRGEIGAEPVEIGIMIEVPSAALMAPEFAREVDFFSVGTNDLAQYTLAMDRMHPEVGKGADGLHPAVLRLIEMTVRAADAQGKWVGVCGGVAGEARGALILSGLGVTELSMSSPAIPNVKAALRATTIGNARRFAQKALKCRDAAEVRALALPN